MTGWNAGSLPICRRDPLTLAAFRMVIDDPHTPEFLRKEVTAYRAKLLAEPHFRDCWRQQANSHSIRPGQNYRRNPLVSLSRSRVPGGWHANSSPQGFKVALRSGSGP